MLKLSICIFAYKQIAQIKAQLDVLVSYGGNDIEVVISDDTPDDSIVSLVKSYRDDRFRYVKNGLGAGADGNYLNAIMAADSEYVWIFRSSDSALTNKIAEVISVIETYPDCALYFFSSLLGGNLKEKKYKDKVCKEVWYSGTLHPSGYVINKKYCDFTLYQEYIKKYFGDFSSSNVAFELLQADLGLKAKTLFSEISAWKYTETTVRTDKAVNSPRGKNPFALEFEYKRYALMLDFASAIPDDRERLRFTRKVIHTFAKQILHVFGKRNSSRSFLEHYGCDKVVFNPCQEKNKFVEETYRNLKLVDSKYRQYKLLVKKEALIYGVIKPLIYRMKHKNDK